MFFTFSTRNHLSTTEVDAVDEFFSFLVLALSSGHDGKEGGFGFQDYVPYLVLSDRDERYLGRG